MKRFLEGKKNLQIGMYWTILTLSGERDSTLERLSDVTWNKARPKSLTTS